jgi:hypothetical protein
MEEEGGPQLRTLAYLPPPPDHYYVGAHSCTRNSRRWLGISRVGAPLWTIGAGGFPH